MDKRQQRQFDREKIVLRYLVALDGGDLDTIAAILQEAEQDAELEKMLLEVNDLAAAELNQADDAQAVAAQDAVIVAELVQTYLVSTLSESAPEPPPLTVGNVIARIHADAAAQQVRVERESLAATRPYQSLETPLPADLSLRRVAQLLEQLDVKVSRRFQDLFRETALFLRMGRNQGMARLAATRRQQQSRSTPNTPPASKSSESTPTDEEPT
jgi:hypothetical protein